MPQLNAVDRIPMQLDYTYVYVERAKPIVCSVERMIIQAVDR
jgi:hypothetical protein